MLLKLPYILSWRYYWDVPTAVYDNYLRQLENVMERWLTIIAERDRKSGARLARQWKELPEKSRLRFLTAPETYSRFAAQDVNQAKQEVAFAFESLSAELCSLQKGGCLDNSSWTALGDLYFPKCSPTHIANKVVNPLRWDPESAFRAPRIAEHIVLDGLSPYATFSISGFECEMATHSTEELDVILDKLKQAFALVQEIHKPIANLISLMTKTITVQKDLSAPNGFGSSSWSRFIGKTALTNAHLAHVDSLRLANALVHEAIHSFLYMVERMETFYIFEDRDFKAPSPWTGNELSLRSYVHACFVWFGLWNFWNMALASNVVTHDEADNYIRCPRSGFKKGIFRETIAVIRQHVSLPVFEAIQVMQDTVTGFNDKRLGK